MRLPLPAKGRLTAAHAGRLQKNGWRGTSEASPIAAEALQRIAALYRIESEIRGRKPDERRAVRQQRSRPLLADLEPWLREKQALVGWKSKLAEAIRYALSHWRGLIRFLDDGRIEIDSNTVERSIRPIALNRKNALFAGSDGGGENRAVIASLFETCLCRGRHRQVYAGWRTMPNGRVFAKRPRDLAAA